MIDLMVISSEFFPRTNPEAQLTYKLCSELEKSGVHCELITSQGVPETMKTRCAFPVSDRHNQWNFGEVCQLAWDIVQKKPAAVMLLYIPHMYCSNPMIIWLPRLLKMLRVKAHIAIYFSQVNPPYTLLSRFFKKRTSWHYGSLLSADSLITLCQKHANRIKTIDPALSKKLFVLPIAPIADNAFPLPAPNSENHLAVRKQTGVWTLVYLGGLYLLKGLEYLIEAVGLLKSQGHSIHLYIIGDLGGYAQFSKKDTDYKNSLLQLVRHLNVTDSVFFQGFIHDTEMIKQLLRNADLGILPYGDGLSANNSSYALMAECGLPVVSTHGEALDSFWNDGHNVLLCRPKDAQDLADKIARVMQTPSLKSAIAAGGLQISREIMNWDKIMTTMLSILHLKKAGEHV